MSKKHKKTETAQTEFILSLTTECDFRAKPSNKKPRAKIKGENDEFS